MVDQVFSVKRRVFEETEVSGAVWKVAYADFVTAMMAFFLLLWLTSVLTQQQAAGVSDYFSPKVEAKQAELTRPLEGLTFDPENVMAALLSADNPSRNTPNFGGERSGDKSGEERVDPEESGVSNADVFPLNDEDSTRLEEKGSSLGSHLSDAPRLQPKKNSFTVEDTPIGVRIDLVSEDGSIIFESTTSAELTESGRRFISRVFGEVVRLPNDLIIVGHTQDRIILQELQPGIDTWNLSLERALAVRLWLQKLGFPEERILRIDGRADTLNRPIQDPSLQHLQNRVSLYLVAQKPLELGDIAKPISDINIEDIAPRSALQNSGR